MTICESIAHRGWSAVYPENTLRAFDEALKLGVDGCECDVRLSADGIPYLMHDHNFLRTTGRDAPGDSLTMAEIARLDAGRWKAPEFDGEGLPTLAEALDIHRGRGQLIIEIKDPGPPDAVAEAVAAVIDAADARAWVSLIAFSFDHAVAAARRLPDVRTCWLLSKIDSSPAALAALVDQLRTHDLTGLDAHHAAVTPELSAALHAAGQKLWVWTVNQDAEFDHVRAVGVDSITSDRPDWLLPRLGEA